MPWTTTGRPQPERDGAPRPAGCGALAVAAGTVGADAGGGGDDGPLPDQNPVRLRLDLAYDGAGFHGWAAQSALRTVQDVTQAAIGRMLGMPAGPVLTVAGRTDAGVHARGQVAHADVPAGAWDQVSPMAGRRLNRLLPPDIRLLSVAVAPDGFDARFSALWRRYSYRVCDDPAAADPLRRGDTLWHRAPLDLGRMNQAGAACLGEHDFAAFCRRREGGTTVRELLQLSWTRLSPGIAVAAVTADAFCHNMVRALAGALLAIGDGRRDPQWLADLLAARVRDPAVRVAPPHPLCLEEVRYPPAAQLPGCAAATRRVRTGPQLPPARGTSTR